MAAQLSYADILHQVEQLSVEEQARLIQEVRERLLGFGMWQDRTDMADPELYFQRLREAESKRPDGTLKTPEKYLAETAEWDE
jgi:hypothetical protein